MCLTLLLQLLIKTVQPQRKVTFCCCLHTLQNEFFCISYHLLLITFVILMLLLSMYCLFNELYTSFLLNCKINLCKDGQDEILLIGRNKAQKMFAV